MKSPVKVLPKRRRGRPTKEEALAWQELLNGSNKQQQSLINEESSSSSASIDTDDSTPSSSSSSSASSSPLVVAPSNSNVNGPASSTPKTQSRHAYRLTYKINAVRYAEKYDLSKASRKFKVDRKTVRTWLRSKNDLLEEAKKKNKFRLSRGDSALYPAVETELYRWILDKRQSGICVNKRMITTKALIINDDDKFVASNGWFDNFLERKNLVLRRITTSGRELPRETGKIVTDFLKFCNDRFVYREFNGDSLINMDETSIYLDSPYSTTYSESGVRRVSAVTTGNTQTRVSIAFSATASSKKLKPLILIPRKNPLKNFVPPNNVVIIYGTNGNFNDSIIGNQFVDKVIKPHMILNDLERVDLLFDCAPCHCTSVVSNAFAAANVNPIFVPKRLTNLLQPADIAWFRPLKALYSNYWNNWFVNSEKSYTKSGNIRSPGYAQIINWVSEIWEAFDPMIIKNSFDQAGITSNMIDVFHRQLKHFILNQEFTDDIDDDDAQNVNGFFSGEEVTTDEIFDPTDSSDDESDIEIN